MKQDRPGGMLEIPDSLGRDVDKFAAGKAPPPPIEAFLPDSTLAEIEKATAAKSEPVRAENLIPITPASAAARRTQHGESLPAMPSMRRVIPAPYQRPRISAGSHGKSWQSCRADQVAEGDIVPGVGQVVYAQEKVVYTPLSDYRPQLEPGTPADTMVAAGLEVVLAGKGGVVVVHHPDTMVQVFRAAPQ